MDAFQASSKPKIQVLYFDSFLELFKNPLKIPFSTLEKRKIERCPGLELIQARMWQKCDGDIARVFKCTGIVPADAAVATHHSLQ